MLPGPWKVLSRQPLVLLLAIMVASEAPQGRLLVKSTHSLKPDDLGLKLGLPLSTVLPLRQGIKPLSDSASPSAKWDQ